MRSVVRVTLIAFAASVAAVVAFPALLALRAAESRVYEPERYDFVLLAAATFAIALGAQVVAWRRATYIAIVAMLGGASLLFAALAAFSIGIALVPAGIVFLLLLYRALRRYPLSIGRPSALGGAIVGYGAVLLYVAQAVPPTAECFRNGAGSSGPRWGLPQAITSSGGGGPTGGVFTGRMEFSHTVVTFRCEDGRLVEFQRTPR